MVAVEATWWRRARRIHAVTRADGEGERGERGGEPKGGEGWAGEVEEVRHRERVVADAAMCEERTDVRNEGEMAGGPEAVGERGGDGEAEDGE